MYLQHITNVTYKRSGNRRSWDPLTSLVSHLQHFDCINCCQQLKQQRSREKVETIQHKLLGLKNETKNPRTRKMSQIWLKNQRWRKIKQAMLWSNKIKVLTIAAVIFRIINKEMFCGTKEETSKHAVSLIPTSLLTRESIAIDQFCQFLRTGN